MTGGALLTAWLAPVSFVQAADGDAPAPDKSHYHLFNPTPRELMREFNTDRPDKTESPYTLDAGHFQLEMDVLNYSFDRYNGLPNNTRVESVAMAPVNLKIGLRDNVDFQLVLQTYNSVRTRDSVTGVTQQSGFGDVISRLKINLWGLMSSFSNPCSDSPNARLKNTGAPLAMPWVAWRIIWMDRR